MKAKVTLENYVSYDRDGASWCLSPTKVEFNGTALTEGGQSDKAFVDACVALGALPGKYSRYVQYYNDNPVVYGVPDPTVTVAGVVLQVEDLVQEASDETPHPTFEIEVSVPDGFSL